MQNSANSSPKRIDLIRISLDLGSESTVAYVQRPQGEPEKINLQTYLPALTIKPDLIWDQIDEPSHRLRSRYAVNDQYAPGKQLTQRVNRLYGYVEILPLDHARTPLLRHDAYAALPKPPEDAIKTTDDLLKNKCIYRFIDDILTSFEYSNLLPNAKLVFQAGLAFDRKYSAAEYTDATGEQKHIKPFELSPVESIKNQLCLILENFVRPRLAGSGSVPEWDECVVILTVPNTYSSYHRQAIADAIEQTLGCQAETISESDAIVYHHIRELPQEQALKRKELEDIDQRYLTIDIGKGTTDLTLMRISYRDMDPEQKLLRGLPPDKRVKCHANVQVQVGRPSGGAKATYLIAQFLERLVDHAIPQLLSSLIADPQHLREVRDLEISPFRLTTKSRLVKPVASANLTRVLIEFEKICDWYKKNLDLDVDGTATLGVYPSHTDVANVAMVSDYIAEWLQSYLSHVNVNLDDDSRQKCSEEIARVITHIPNPSNSSTNVLSAWRQLSEGIRVYVEENVDNMLIELGNDLFAAQNKWPYSDPVTALEEITGVRQKGSIKRLRTHIVIAGQGSQLKPLRRRLEAVIEAAGITLNPQPSAVQVRQTKSISRPVPPSGGLVQRTFQIFRALLAQLRYLFEGLFSNDSELTPVDPKDHIASTLFGENLKDGCAKGALAWFSDWPVVENPHKVHGQIIIRPLNMKEELVDMDRLNSDLEVEFNFEDHDVAAQIFYSPVRIPKQGTLRPYSYIGSFDACQNITIAQFGAKLGKCSLKITADNGQEFLMKDVGIYGSEAAQSLREVLWPAVLLDE